mmetsp:Transcript_12014/g.23959  ORF Transcript_12014/g.23959 Transcript_12014/m.23959 type:complete len:168 (+) Transcript_12014:139-642(+)
MPASLLAHAALSVSCTRSINVIIATISSIFIIVIIFKGKTPLSAEAPLPCLLPLTGPSAAHKPHTRHAQHTIQTAAALVDDITALTQTRTYPRMLTPARTFIARGSFSPFQGFVACKLRTDARTHTRTQNQAEECASSSVLQNSPLPPNCHSTCHHSDSHASLRRGI